MIFEPTIEQKKIFDFFKHGEGHGIIDAVAGSGKTSTILNGVEHISNNKSILFCAYNKKIQTEIQNKINSNREVFVFTTYALGLKILRSNYSVFSKRVDKSKYFKILNKKLEKDDHTKEYKVRSDFTNAFDTIRYIYYSNKEANEPDLFYKEFYSNYYRLIDLVRYTLTYSKPEKDFLSVIEKYAIDISLDNKLLCKKYKEIIDISIYEGIKQSLNNGSYDFADMIFLPNILKLFPKESFDILFIDECQDLSKAQLFTILKYLKPSEGRVFAVGDPFQSIYGFAGASPKSFDNIRKLLNPIDFKLSNCFRSSKTIVELASEIRSDISTSNKNLGRIKEINYDELTNYLNLGDFVLSRNNSNLIELLFDLIKNDISCKILGKDDILKSIKELLPNAVFNNRRFYQNLPNHLEILKSKTEKKLSNNPANLEKLQNLSDSIEVLIIAYHHCYNFSCLEELFEYLEKLMNSSNPDSVLLSSIHKSKGLENKTVFILEYNKLPAIKETMLDWQKYQEKCLKYVAITRAKTNLFLVKSKPVRQESISFVEEENEF